MSPGRRWEEAAKPVRILELLIGGQQGLDTVPMAANPKYQLTSCLGLSQNHPGIVKLESGDMKASLPFTSLPFYLLATDV